MSLIPQRISGSATLALLQRVREMRAEGIDVASMAAGEPDFPTPDFVIDAAVQGMKAGNTKYVASQGIPAVREAIARDYRERLKAPWVKPEHVVMTAGAKQGLHVALAAIVQPGDEVIVPTPYWVSYPSLVKSVGGVPKKVASFEKDDFVPTVETLEAAYTPKTKILIFSSPNNPTGKMIRQEHLRALVEWCTKRDVFMIYDEIYERLVLGDRPHVTPFEFLSEAQSEKILCVNAFSKSLSMTGWRMGYIVAHKENIKALTDLQSQFLTCIPGFVQDAGVVGMAKATEFLRPIVELFKKRLNLLLGELEKIPNTHALRPDGAFYTMLNVEKIIAPKGLKSDDELCKALLDDHRVVVIPGTSFGMPGWVRLSFATSEQEILESVKRIAAYCAK